MKNAIYTELEKEGLLFDLETQSWKNKIELEEMEVECPNLYHFVYKSDRLSQIVSSADNPCVPDHFSVYRRLQSKLNEHSMRHYVSYSLDIY